LYLYTYYVLFYSITNGFNIENNNPIANGVPDSSSILEMINVPGTNEPNM